MCKFLRIHFFQFSKLLCSLIRFVGLKLQTELKYLKLIVNFNKVIKSYRTDPAH